MEVISNNEKVLVLWYEAGKEIHFYIWRKVKIPVEFSILLCYNNYIKPHTRQAILYLQGEKYGTVCNVRRKQIATPSKDR